MNEQEAGSTPSTSSRLHNNNSERHSRLKRKSKRKSKDTNSLPLPLNKGPSWYDLRYRSGTDPSSPSIPSKGHKSKFSERAQSLQCLSKEDSDKLSRILIHESNGDGGGTLVCSGPRDSIYDSSGRSSLGNYDI